MSSIPYRPEIDGLRAFAVAPVILFHLGLPYIPGGFIGVDVFFVISGFLITSIIFSEMQQGTFSLREFWARRIRRILPAMIFVTASTLLFTYLFVFRLDQQDIGKQAVAALLSAANILLWRTTGDYWGRASEESPFLHAWSLSVEEQFYLFFPVLFWVVFKYKRNWLRGYLMTFVFISFLIFSWGLNSHPTATFYLLPTRAWELGVGSLLAIWLTSRESENTNKGILSIAGLVTLSASYLLIDSLNLSVCFAVLGTTLIIGFGRDGLCNQILSQRFLIHIGKLSYSLYLWHWPVIVFRKKMDLDWDAVSDTAILIPIIYILSLGTYQFIEKPTRRKHGIVLRILVAGGLVAVSGLWIACTTRTYDTKGYETPLWIEYSCRKNWAPSRSSHMSGVEHTNPYYTTDSFTSGLGIQINCESESPKIVVLGDSHATMWSEAIVDIAKKYQIPIAFFTMDGGESPFFEIPVQASAPTHHLSSDEKLQYDKMRLKAISSWKPQLIIISARWNQAHLESSGDLLNFLNARGVSVLLLEDPPELAMPDKNLLQYLAHQKLLTGSTVYCASQDAKDEKKREIVRTIAASYANVIFLSTYDIFKSEAGVTVILDHIPLYLDDDHLTSQGGALLSQRLDESMRGILSIEEE